VRLLMGIVRYHFGSVEDASACLEGARPFLDGVVSTWHSPIFHQYAALAIHSLPAERRTALRAPADASLAALSQLAAQAPDNFAHRVHLVEAERARADGDLEGALRHCATAIEQADAQGFTNDVALAHELAARCHVERRDAASAARHARSAGAAYQRLGARAKIA
jgi:histidine kinase